MHRIISVSSNERFMIWKNERSFGGNWIRLVTQFNLTTADWARVWDITEGNPW